MSTELRTELEKLVTEYKSAPNIILGTDDWMSGWLRCIEQVVVDLRLLLDTTKG